MKSPESSTADSASRKEWFIAPSSDQIAEARGMTFDQAVDLCAEQLGFENPSDRHVRRALEMGLSRAEGTLRTTENPDGLYFVNAAIEEGRSVYNGILRRRTIQAKAESTQATDLSEVA